MNVRCRVRITGRVQGVGFRDFVRRRATAIGLVGFVRNEPDGSVTAEIEGGREIVQSFLDLLRDSPPRFAQVEEVDVQDVTPTGDASFRITS